MHFGHAADEEAEECADGGDACDHDCYAGFSYCFIEAVCDGAVFSVVPVRVQYVYAVVYADPNDEGCDAPCEGAEWYAQVPHGSVEPDDAEADDEEREYCCVEASVE